MRGVISQNMCVVPHPSGFDGVTPGDIAVDVPGSTDLISNCSTVKSKNLPAADRLNKIFCQVLNALLGMYQVRQRAGVGHIGQLLGSANSVLSC